MRFPIPPRALTFGRGPLLPFLLLLLRPGGLLPMLVIALLLLLTTASVPAAPSPSLLRDRQAAMESLHPRALFPTRARRARLRQPWRTAAGQHVGREWLDFNHLLGQTAP